MKTCFFLNIYINVNSSVKVQYSNGISTFVTDDAVKGQLKVINYNLYKIKILSDC